MIKPQDKVSNGKILEGRNYSKSSGVGDLVDAIGLDGPIEDTSSAFLASNAINRVMAFVEFGLSGPGERYNYDDEHVFDGLSEIVRACRLVSTRVENYLFWLSDKEMIERREAEK